MASKNVDPFGLTLKLKLSLPNSPIRARAENPVLKAKAASFPAAALFTELHAAPMAHVDVLGQGRKALEEANFWHDPGSQRAIYRWGVPAQEVLDRAVALRRRLDQQRDTALPGFSDRLVMVVEDADGTVVNRVDLPVDTGEFVWDPVDLADQPLADGRYVFTLESYRDETELGIAEMASYQRVTELRSGLAGLSLLLEGGVEIGIGEVTAVRG